MGHQAFVSVGEMASTCQFVSSSESRSTLSVVLLRRGLLHIAWVGDSKVVLGRLASSPANISHGACSSDTIARHPLAPVPHPELRAIELTADQDASNDVPQLCSGISAAFVHQNRGSFSPRGFLLTASMGMVDS